MYSIQVVFDKGSEDFIIAPTFCNIIIIHKLILRSNRRIILRMNSRTVQNLAKTSQIKTPLCPIAHNSIQNVRTALQQKKKQIQIQCQKIEQQAEAKKQARDQAIKKHKHLHELARQKKVSMINEENKHYLSSNQSEQAVYLKSKDSFSVEKQFQVVTLSTAVFYPPSCSAYDMTYCKGNDCVYVYGGISCTSELEEGLKQYFYQLEDGIWKEIKPVSLYTPMPRYGHTITATNDSLLLFGGVSQYKEKLKDRCFYPDVWAFNIHKSNWKVLEFTGPMIKNRKSHAACMYGKFYIVYGGIDDSEEVINEISWVNIEERKSRWRSKHIQGRFNHQIIVLQNQHGRDYLFIYGGRNSESQITGSFVMYPIYFNEGQLHFKEPQKISMQMTPCEFPIMKALDNGLLVMGGIDENNEAVSQCLHYNIDKKTTTEIKSGIDWRELRGAKGVSINGRSVYVLSGSNSKKYKAIKINVVLPLQEQFKYKL